MTAPRKLTSRDELDHIEDALVDAILNAAAADLREEAKAAGCDADQCIADMDAAIGRARAACARKALETARTELAAWRSDSGRKPGLSRDTARARFERLRSGDPDLASRMTMAARKGEGLSDRDFEGVLDDLSELDRLEREDG
jgi:hypothetical protein